jgi:hypothetical protein
MIESRHIEPASRLDAARMESVYLLSQRVRLSGRGTWSDFWVWRGGGVGGRKRSSQWWSTMMKLTIVFVGKGTEPGSCC